MMDKVTFYYFDYASWRKLSDATLVPGTRYHVKYRWYKQHTYTPVKYR